MPVGAGAAATVAADAPSFRRRPPGDAGCAARDPLPVTPARALAGLGAQALLATPSAADVTLARRTGMDWEDVLDAGPSDLDTLSRARALLGITSKTGLPPRPAPSMATQLGIF